MNQKQVTDMVAEALRADMPPWRIPWNPDPNSGFPTNPVTNQPYGGVNPLLLNMSSLRRGYPSKWWATYKQWQTVGCRVRAKPEDVAEGEWGTKITRWEQGGVKTPQTVVLFNAKQVYGGGWRMKSAAEYQVTITEASAEGIDRHDADQAIGEYLAKVECPDEPKRRLIEDIGICYIETALGVMHHDDLLHHHEYLKIWLREMDADQHYIYQAAAQAEGVVRAILDAVKKEK